MLNPWAPSFAHSGYLCLYVATECASARAELNLIHVEPNPHLEAYEPLTQATNYSVWLVGSHLNLVVSFRIFAL